jgi:hypothetical protein
VYLPSALPRLAELLPVRVRVGEHLAVVDSDDGGRSEGEGGEDGKGLHDDV